MTESGKKSILSVACAMLGITIGVAGALIADRIGLGERGAVTSAEVAHVKERLGKVEDRQQQSISIREFQQFERRMEQRLDTVEAKLNELLRRR